jgi:LPS export ABC transporter protein LptC
MKKRYLLTLLIISGLLLSYFYEPSLDTFSPAHESIQSDPINFYLKNLETRTFNADGIHSNSISSHYAVQHTKKKQIILDQPTMQIALNMAPWTAKAEKGLSSENMKKITLQNQVTLSRSDGMADISTEILVFDSTDEVAYTQSAVEILAKGSKTNADGVSIDLAKEIIHLKKHVKTYYVPEAASHSRHHSKS